MKRFPYLRIVAILVGSFSFVRLLMLAKTIQYPVQLVEWLHQVEALVSSVSLDVLKLLVVEPVLNILRSHGWNIPQLDEMWRNVFVLNSLLLGSAARHQLKAGWLIAVSSMLGLMGAVVAGLWPGKGIAVGYLVSWALFYSINYMQLGTWRKDLTSMLFAASVLTGYCVVLDNPRELPLSALFAVICVISAALDERRVAWVMFTYAAVFAVSGWLTRYADTRSSLLLVAVFVLATAIGFTGLGARDNLRLRKGGWSGLLADTEFNIGIDILAVMGVALFFTLALASTST